MDKQLVELQLRQLSRLLETKRVTFDVAHMVIFSDYPSAQFILSVLGSGAEMNQDIKFRLYAELKRLLSDSRPVL